MRPRGARATLSAFCGLIVALAMACSSSASSAPRSATAVTGATTIDARLSTTGTKTNAQGWPRVEGPHGQRYCEVLLLRVIDAHLNGEVWNSYGLNECPEAEWKALDPGAIKTQRGVIAVLLNGPRYWLMDAIEKKPGDEGRQTTTFGSLEMFLGATVDLGPLPPNLASYTERHVARETVFEYAAGARVYELHTPDGKAYIMQSYSQQSNPTLNEADLPDLAAHLTLPAGWTYSARMLDADGLRIVTSGSDATVVQDDLSNTYQLVVSG